MKKGYLSIYLLFVFIFFISQGFSAGTPYLASDNAPTASNHVPENKGIVVQHKRVPTATSVELGKISEQLIPYLEGAAKSLEGFDKLQKELGDLSLDVFNNLMRVKKEVLSPVAWAVRGYFQAKLQILHGILTYDNNFDLYESVRSAQAAPEFLKAKAVMGMLSMWREKQTKKLKHKEVVRFMVAVINCKEAAAKDRTEACFKYVDYISSRATDDKIGNYFYSYLEQVIPLNDVDTKAYAQAVYRQADIVDQYNIKAVTMDAMSAKLQQIQNSQHLTRGERRQIKLWLASSSECSFCCLRFRYFLFSCETCD